MIRKGLAVFIILLVIILYLFPKKSYNYYENIKHVRSNFSVEQFSDTLVLKVPLNKLESENLPSYFILRDLIAYYLYEDFISSDSKFVTIFGISSGLDSQRFYSNTYSRHDIAQNYILHSNCKKMLEVKEYLYFNCNYDWVMYGNTILISLNEQNGSFQNLSVSKISSTPDILSVLIGFVSDCCNMKRTDNLTLLQYLQDGKNTYDDFDKLWPNYGSHVGNIISICYNN